MQVQSFTQADAVYSRRRYGTDHRTIENHTKVVKHFDSYGVMLHNTCIVQYIPSFLDRPEQVRLDAGGWYTDVTLRRISEFSPFRIHRVNGRWYVEYDVRLDVRQLEPFTDGLTFEETATGWTPVEDTRLSLEQVRLQDLHNSRIKRLVSHYTRGRRFMHHGGGSEDCALCVFNEVMQVPAGDMLGEYEHLITHMIDDVFVIQLCESAARESGRDPGEWHLLQPRELRRFLEGRLLMGAVGGKTGRRPRGSVAWPITRRRRDMRVRRLAS